MLKDGEIPKYNRNKPKSSPVMDPYREIIETILEYDNASTQVVKILEGPDREEHTWFSSLRAHYLFNSLFARPCRGNEKGSVETLVKYVRKRALVPVPSFQTWDELNDHLLCWCQKEKEKHRDKLDSLSSSDTKMAPNAHANRDHNIGLFVFALIWGKIYSAAVKNLGVLSFFLKIPRDQLVLS